MCRLALMHVYVEGAKTSLSLMPDERLCRLAQRYVVQRGSAWKVDCGDADPRSHLIAPSAA
jgi:hypothetical protein